MIKDLRYMTVTEAASALNVSRQRVHQLVQKGVLPVIRVKIPTPPGVIYKFRRDVIMRRKREVRR